MFDKFTNSMAHPIVEYLVSNAHNWALVGATAWVGLKAAAIARGQAEIQRQQAHLETERLRWDLWQRRLQLYELVWQYMSEVVRSGERASNETEGQLLNSRPQLQFLFGDENLGWVDEMMNVAGQLRSYAHVQRANPSRAADPDASGENLRQAMWLSDQLGKLPVRFGPYLDFARYRRE